MPVGKNNDLVALFPLLVLNIYIPLNEEREEKRGGKIIMEWVTTGMTNVTAWFNGLFDVISGNPVLGAVFVGTVVVPIAFGVLRRFTR